MNCLKLPFLLYLFFPLMGLSQNYTWSEQNSTTTNQLSEIKFVNNFEGYAAGYGGSIVRTGNGGVSWGQLPSPTTDIIAGMDFYDFNSGFIAANLGKVYKTTNAGLNWTQIFSTPDYANALKIYNNRLLVGFTEYVMYTDDNGTNWDSAYCPVNGSVISLTFTQSNTGYALGQSNYIAKTTDGGNTWNFQTVVNTGGQDLRAIYAINTTTIIGVGTLGTIVKSIDGGVVWTPVTSGTTQDLYDLEFTNATHGIIVGLNNTVLETINGGSNWTPAATSNAGNLFGVSCKTNSIAYISGSGGKIYRSPAGVEDIFSMSYLGPDTVCAGQPFEFTFQFTNVGGGPSFNPGFTVIEFGGGSVFGDTITYQGTVDSGDVVVHTEPNAVLNTTGTITVVIFAVEDNVQSNNTILATIEVVAPDNYSVTGTTYFCPGDTVILEATGGNSYNWISGISGNVNDPVQEVYPEQSTSYTVEITQDICVFTEDIWVYPDPNCDDNIDSIVPSPAEHYAFSPNDDGVNDYLVLDFLDPLAVNNVVVIYNRWGDIVFETDNYNNTDMYWDGTYNSRPPLAGTYFFVAETNNFGSVRGWVQVVK